MGGFLRIYPVGLDVVAQCLGLLGRSKDPILDNDYSAVASAPAECMPEATVAPPNGLTASSSNLPCL